MENHRSFTITKIPIHTKIIDPENSIFSIIFYFFWRICKQYPTVTVPHASTSKQSSAQLCCRLVITMLRCHSALGQPDLAPACLLPALEAEWNPLGFFLLPFPVNNKVKRNNTLKLKFP